ncbi:MAG: sulfatase-like hydrolase/transferase [Bacteroidetes bacterium]|nr:sulfatase-like hydrolase/transferase [Bacteroidota bacterium]
MMKIIPAYIKYFTKHIICSLLIMSSFRVILFISTFDKSQTTDPLLIENILQTLFMGIRFDGVIIGYVMILPIVVIGTASVFYKKVRVLMNMVILYLIISYVIIIFMHCVDIPFFKNFGLRLDTSSLIWFDDFGYMINMIIRDWAFLGYFFLFMSLTCLLIFYIIKQRKKITSINHKPISNNKTTRILVNILSVLLFSSLLVLMARGSLSKKTTIKVGTAYFSNNQYLNKIALNPVFSFLYAYKLDLKDISQIDYMKKEKAIDLSKSYLSIPVTDSTLIKNYKTWQSENKDDLTNKNVIIIIMESMGSFKMGKYNGTKNLTPFLNKLIERSLYFDNIYTDGIHTFNGIYSTLFSFPSLYKMQPLEALLNVPHEGIASVLKENGYSTSFFSTHDPNFHNVSGFLKANDFQNIYANYPKKWIVSHNGVPDHKMFEYSIPILNEKFNTGKPFFTVFMTASDHSPHIIPDNIEFNPQTNKLKFQITEYADWSISNFFELASQQEWYDNTIFVLIADHGQNMGHTYDMPLSFHSTPLIIHTPSSQIFDTLHCLGGQIDVAPTVLGLLNIFHENNSMGVNLFTNHRPFMYFSSDNQIGCLDHDYYLIIRPDKKETLYKYYDLNKDDYYDVFRLKVDSMKDYMYSMMQTTQLLNNTDLN